MNEKKKKLKLDELKVQSFVTSFDKEHFNTNAIKGGEEAIDDPDTFGCTLGGETCQCPVPVPCDKI